LRLQCNSVTRRSKTISPTYSKNCKSHAVPKLPRSSLSVRPEGTPSATRNSGMQDSKTSNPYPSLVARGELAGRRTPRRYVISHARLFALKTRHCLFTGLRGRWYSSPYSLKDTARGCDGLELSTEAKV